MHVVDGRASSSVRAVKPVLRRTPNNPADHHANRHTWASHATPSRLVIQDAVFGSQLGAVAGTFDDDLVGRVGEPVQGTIAKDGIVEEAQPLVHAAIGSDAKAGSAMTLDDELVQI